MKSTKIFWQHCKRLHAQGGIAISKISLPKIGLRNIKTSLAVFLCIVLYALLDRDGLLLAAFAALICMQDSVEKSLIDGANRIIGTICGGVLGAVVMSFAHTDVHFIWTASLSAAGISALIYVGVLIHKRQSIAISCFTFLVIAMDISNTDYTPFMAATHRVLDTVIGITIAVLVNRFFFMPENDRQIRKAKGKKVSGLRYILKRAHQHMISKWGGGTTTEIYIHPTNALYTDRNFKWRISSATVDLDESNFTQLKGYTRHLMVLDGSMRLVHEGNHAVDLEQFGQDFFQGEWRTHSYGKCVDLNIMLATGFSAKLAQIRHGEAVTLPQNGLVAFLCLENNVNVHVTRGGSSEKTSDDARGKVLFEETLQKSDYLSLDEMETLEQPPVITLTKSTSDTENLPVLAIMIHIFEIAATVPSGVKRK